MARRGVGRYQCCSACDLRMMGRRLTDGCVLCSTLLADEPALLQGWIGVGLDSTILEASVEHTLGRWPSTPPSPLFPPRPCPPPPPRNTATSALLQQQQHRQPKGTLLRQE